MKDTEYCKWKLDDVEINLWKTNCDNDFQITNGTPKENAMHYCCYCGKKINASS